MARMGERRAAYGVREETCTKATTLKETRRSWENNIKGGLIWVARHGLVWFRKGTSVGLL